MIARVLQEAARINNVEVIELLLDDGVHPDVRVKMEDKAAIEVADTSEVRQLLYKHGGKLLFPPDGCPPDWRRVGSQDDERQRPSNACLKGGTPCNGEFRGLIVDIFSVGEAPYDERHLISHPTVEEMIHTRSPGGIMDQLGSPPVQGCKHFVRWIHLPMNHVSSAFTVLGPQGTSVTNFCYR
jgi:hypothetical protein